MRTARLAIALFGSTTLAALGLWACSSSTTSDGSTGPASTAPTSTKPASTTTSTTTPPPPADPGDAGSDCGKAATLHPQTDSGTYCPFSATAGGKNVTCTTGEQCCETPASAGTPSTCVTVGTACPVSGSTVWECESPAGCTGGKKCCAHAADGGAVTVGQDTCGPYLSHFGGTSCQTTCAAGELVVCEQPSDCTTGTCTAVKPKGNDIGVCN